MAKKLLCFVQKCGQRWYGIAWKQMAEIKEKAIDPKKREAETEEVDESHAHRRGNGESGWIRMWEIDSRPWVVL